MKKNKLLKIFIATILLISIQISVIAATTGVVNTDTVRVRSKATTNSAIVALVSIGDKVTITGQEGDWYKVQAKDEDGNLKNGYIRKDLLTVNGKVSETEPVDTNKDNEEQPTENNGSTNQEQPTENNEATNQEQPEENNEQEPEPNNSGDNKEPEENNNSADSQEPSKTDETINNDQPVDNTISTTNVKDKTISTIKRTSSLSSGNKIKLTQNVKIKILPSANSSNIAELQANTEATVLEVINSWCRIETEGACGWIRIDQ